MPDNTRVRIPEFVIPGRRLGRHVNHDPRSLAFQVPRRAGAVQSVQHARAIPVLDQGSLGSCTGNAAEGALGTAPIYATIPGTVAVRPTGDATVDEQQAVALYSAATSLDDFDGQYPPTDTGSDGLSVAKACQRAGLISGYRHATSLDAALAALAVRPVITGVNWYEGMDEPDRDGLVHVSGQVRGGHEFVLDEIVADEQLIGFTNSWSTDWGVDGRAYISFDDFERLLHEQGDVTDFVPLTEPAPTPIDPDDPDAELLGCIPGIINNLQRWYDRKKG